MGITARESTSSTTVANDVAVSTAVVEAVSAASNTTVLELPPLYDAVNPDALDSLFTDERRVGEVAFRYAGYRVVVYADRTVEVSG